MTADLGFRHVFTAGSDPSAPTLLLLHGTGGDERDLLPFGELYPGAAVLSPRGKVLENGMPRFFRRLAEGVLDEEDLKLRANELADFVAAASARYGFDPARVVAVGYSNGANIASAVMLLRPRALRGGALLRAMVPLVPDSGKPDMLAGTTALISNGRMDPLVPAAETDRLAGLLRGFGAVVDVKLQAAGHQLLPADVGALKTWLQSIE